MKHEFNRPILYISLLSDIINNHSDTHAVYSTVASDEFTIRTPDTLMSGEATELLIANCCPTLCAPKKLLISDIQYILASIKIASQGNNLELLIKCPKCKESDPYDINLQKIISSLTAKLWFTPLIMDDNLSITFYPPSYKDFNKFSLTEFKINKQLHYISLSKNQEEFMSLTSSLLEQKRKLYLEFQTLSIKSVTSNNLLITEKNYIEEWLLECDISTKKQLDDYLAAAQKETSLPDLDITCSSCNHKFLVPVDLDSSTQFRQKLISLTEEEILSLLEKMSEETKNLTNELLKMCRFMHGSISYTEAYSLTLYERQCIAKIIEENIELTKESGISFL
jgi:hypothetical protein